MPENYWSSQAQGARSDELLWRIRAYVIEVIVGFIWLDIFTLPRNQLEPRFIGFGSRLQLHLSLSYAIRLLKDRN